MFLDMEKAFDRVWNAGLPYKLLQAGAPNKLTNLIWPFLQGRTIQYKFPTNSIYQEPLK